MAQSNRILLKLRPGTSLAASASRVDLRPLFDATGQPTAFGLTTGAATWHVADVPADGPTAWDAAHNQVAATLGLDASAVLFAEPDLPQSYPDSNEANAGGSPFAVSQPNCVPEDQDHDQRPAGPGFAWHLRDEFSQLAAARAAVDFRDPNRTRIAHIDTG